MGLKSSTEYSASYKLPTLKEPYKSKMEMLPKKYLQTELPLEPSSNTFMGKELSSISPNEKIAIAKSKGLPKESIRAIEKIVSQKQPKKIELGKQRKHIIGTNEYKQKNEASQKKGGKKPGILFIPIGEAQKLVNSLHGTGTPVLDGKGVFQNKEHVTAPYPIGTVDSGKGMVFTRHFTIHYSNTGTHIVPRYVKNDK